MDKIVFVSFGRKITSLKYLIYPSNLLEYFQISIDQDKQFVFQMLSNFSHGSENVLTNN